MCMHILVCVKYVWPLIQPQSNCKCKSLNNYECIEADVFAGRNTQHVVMNALKGTCLLVKLHNILLWMHWSGYVRWSKYTTCCCEFIEADVFAGQNTQHVVVNSLKLDATFTFWHLTQFYLSGRTFSLNWTNVF